MDKVNRCNFLIEYDKYLIEKYSTTWDKVSADIKTEFDSEVVYNKLQIFTIKSS